ncbi:MAG: bifunctional 5,10-methylenetetrahydrofolate dehydrogenase/5,10-methenyltetrahydrofolate cyclohydrolase [Candidatus Cloacimonetes bacterium]|nr:bifunctional 5,10-methylenetetrahydrofolate dehydrogenase/5,10-methenyltetrahydrofolate cyclohydrolase [Candidatus Cloacimonadota bacterium]
MTVLIAGNNPASEYYTSSIIRRGEKLGYTVHLSRFDSDVSQETVLAKIDQLNSDDSVHAIMIQKPLPEQINPERIALAISPDKDVDALHPVNTGKLFLNQPGFYPCTAEAVIELLKFYEIETQGKKVVVIGRSAVIGKPVAGLLLHKSVFGNATVTICHSSTRRLEEVVRGADIVIAAIGRAGFVTSAMVHAGAVIIDVGVNQVDDSVKGTVYVGDVDYESCLSVSSAITPVPGGVGTVTTAVLMRHVLTAFLNFSAT